MEKKLIIGGVVASVLMASGLAGVASAQTPAEEAKLTATQAIEIALAEVPGTVQEVELEDEGGEKVFEVEIMTADGSEVEVEISAMSGDIVEIENEDDDDEDDDESDD